MSNLQTTVNTAAPQAHFNKAFYDRKLLAIAKTKLVHAKFGQKRSIPKMNGKRVEFRRYDLFDPEIAMSGLVEGITPDGQSLSQTSVEAEVSQYGAYVEISDLLDTTAYDPVKSDSVELLGEQIGTVVEWVTRDVMAAGTSVQYAGGRVSRAAITAADKLTVDEIRRAVRHLKKMKVRFFNDDGEGKARKPHLVSIVSPDATYDLQSDPLWQDVSKYSNAEQIYSGEIGRLFGVVFVESTEAKVFEDAGSGGIDVHGTLIFGRDAYGTVDVAGGGAMKTIIKPAGSSGTEDPLNQRGTVAAKVLAYTAAVLNQNWMLRIEHGVTA